MEDPSNPMNGRELDAADKDLFSLIDGSELDDLFGSMSEPRFVENKANLVDGEANMAERPDAEKSRKNEKYNLRKSLAWDSAFFTSAGVLDAEELSSIMEGSNVGKQQMQRLPGIEEDISKSTDSLSTLESDTLALEGLEIDLFSDIRASIQRSSGSTKLRQSNLNGAREETSQLGKKTTEIKHGNMVKPKPTPKKLNTNLQGDGKMMKLGPSRELVKKPVAIRRESISSLPKSTAASGKGGSMVMAPAKVTMKRMSISAGRIKSDTNNVGNDAGRVTTVSKGDRPGASRSVIPKGASHTKSLGSSNTTRTGNSSTRSSCDSTSSSSSQTSRILPLNGLQGKTKRPAIIPPPGVKSRIPSRVQLKGKHPPNTTRISANSSASMLSPSVSPSSSISEWSSSSSAVTSNQDHNVSKDCSSLHRTVSSDSIASQDLQMHPNQQASCENEIELPGVSGLSAQAFSVANGSVSNQVSAKPSGLRMPSPKIGFFDGVKTGGRTQNATGSMQSRSRLSINRLPKSTTGSSSPGGVLNKGRIGHTAAVKDTPLPAASVKPDSQSNAKRTATGGGRLEGISNAPGKDSNAENSSPIVKLPFGEKQHSESGSSSRKKDGLVRPSKTATHEGMYHSQGNQVSSVVESEHPMGINDDSKVLNPHILHELIHEDAVITELHPVSMLEEGDNAGQIDGNADTVALNAGHEATNIEKNDPVSAVVADQQGPFVEQQVNELIANVEAVDNNASEVDENADTVVQNGEHDATNNEKVRHEAASIEKIDPISAVVVDQQSPFVEQQVNELIANVEAVDNNASEVDENPDTVVQNGEHEATNNEKNDQVCVVATEQQSSLVEEQVNELIANVKAVDNNASEVDENADTVVQSGEHEATNNEKNDQVCVVATEQQSSLVEERVNELIANVEAVGVTRELSDGMDLNFEEVDNNASEVDESADTMVLNGEHEATNNEKNHQICVVVSDQQITFIEQQVNELVAKVEAVEDELRDEIDVNFEEMDNIASKVDENADTVLLNGDHEAANNGKNDPICGVATDQQSTFIEMQVNELIARDEALGNTGELCDKMDVNFEEVDNNASKVDKNADTVVLNGEHEADNHEGVDENADTVMKMLNGEHKADNHEGVDENADTVITDQKSTFTKQQVNELIANVEAVGNTREFCDEMDVNFAEVDNNASEVGENEDTYVLNGEHEAANHEKSDPIFDVVTDQQSTFIEQQVNELIANVEAVSNTRDKVDEDADTVVLNGEHEAANHEKNEPICDVITDQQSAFTEQQVNELIADVEAVENNMELHDEMDVYFEKADNNAANVGENGDTVVLNREHEAANHEMTDPICDITEQQSIVVDQQVNESIANAEAVENNMELHDEMHVNFEKVDNISTKVDENADTEVLNGEHEAANHENDPICDAITDQQSPFTEQQVDELIANAEAVGNTRELCDEIDVNFEVDNNASEVNEDADTDVLNGEHEEANLEKNDPICVVATEQQSTFVEQQVDELIANAEAMGNTRELCDEIDVNLEKVDNNASEVNEDADTDVLNGEHAAANHEESDPICDVVTDQESTVVNQQVNELIANAEAVESKIELQDESATKVDENADTEVLNGEHEAANLEKNDPIFVVATDQQTTSVEQQVNELIANLGAVVLCDEMDENVAPQNNISSVSDSPSDLNQKQEALDLPKKNDLSASSKTLEAIPASRTPFADKNSSPDAYDMETLLNSFTSLSLSTLQAKDVET